MDKNFNHPDPYLHKYYSFLKSGVRILGYIMLFFSVEIGATILILSEIVGILEETV